MDNQPTCDQLFGILDSNPQAAEYKKLLEEVFEERDDQCQWMRAQLLYLQWHTSAEFLLRGEFTLPLAALEAYASGAFL